MHVAGTYDSKTKQAKVFINGEIRNQSLGDGALSRDWGVRAGIGNKERNRPLRGSIDEFRIYNYALKPDEIKALVSACKATAPDTGASIDGGDAPKAEADSPATSGRHYYQVLKPVSSDSDFKIKASLFTAKPKPIQF